MKFPDLRIRPFWRDFLIYLLLAFGWYRLYGAAAARSGASSKVHFEYEKF